MNSFQQFLFALVLVVLGMAVWEVEGHSDDYYTMVEDIQKGINYYTVLRVDEQASSEEIRKSFRKMALQYHPDKNADSDSSDVYSSINYAYQILSNPDTKSEYDDLLINGIPLHEQYYGQYMHRYGAPDHDPRWVIFWLVTVVSACQYFYTWHKYNMYHQMVQLTPRYKNMIKARKERAEQRRRRGKDEADEDTLPEIEIVGIDKPQWKDLFAVHFICFPWYLCQWCFYFGRWAIWYQLLGKPQPDPEEEARMKSGMSEEEWDYQKQVAKEKEEKLRTSAKAKRIRRIMKNRVPEFFDG